MASRAHVIHDYPFGRVPSRPRREVWYRTDEEPVVLPRARSWGMGGGLIAAAFTGSLLVAGAAYAVYATDIPTLNGTEAAPLTRNWEPDPELVRAKVITQLSGPAFAAPSLGSSDSSESPASATPEAPESRATRKTAHSHAAVVDDSASGAQHLPDVAPRTTPLPSSPASPDQTSQPPYPNPTTTPPDAIAPPSTDPATPTPALDPENPYR